MTIRGERHEQRAALGRGVPDQGNRSGELVPTPRGGFVAVDDDADGKPVADWSGVARTTWRYDERGDTIERAYFGADGKPVTTAEITDVTRQRFADALFTVPADFTKADMPMGMDGGRGRGRGRGRE